MIPVSEARARILATLEPLACETVALSDAAGRTLAAPVRSRLTQPPTAVSAMDGYAVRGADVATAPAVLRQVGTAAAGRRFDGTVGPGDAVRIFTGAPVPDGADTVVIQEDVDCDPGGRDPGGAADRVTVRQAARVGQFIRPAGLDFAAATAGPPAGVALTARHIGLAAAMNHPWLTVRRRPRIALLATGDEIVQPGEPIGPSQIVSSNVHALAAMVRAAGGDPVNLGIAPDSIEDLRRAAAAAGGADLLVTTGGASVGDHDLMHAVLGDAGRALDFWRIAMRPGKPLMFGRYRDTPLLGLPGNPVSAMVCGLLFMLPAIHRLLGRADIGPIRMTADLGRALPANDRREDYLRSRFERLDDGRIISHPFDRQDSAMVRLLSDADGLTVRAPDAGPAAAGTPVEVLPFPPGC